jgi:hypothetical protein
MRILFLLIIMITGTIGYSQSGKELDRRNGFKDIKLLSEITSYPNLGFSKNIKDKPKHAIYKPTNGQYKKIGDVSISKLNVYTYRELIYKIEVVVDKDEQLFRSLEKAFGKINSSIASKNSFWEGSKVKLGYSVEGSKKVKLTYSSKEINLIIAQDKKKDIDSLSTEF